MRILVLWFLIVMVFNVFSQGSIKGSVVDKDSEFPLPGVTVILADSTVDSNVVVTDFMGEFSFRNIPLGRHTIILQHNFYKQSSAQHILVTAGKVTNLELKMEELLASNNKISDSVVQQKEINLTVKKKTKEKNDMASVSSTSFTVEEAIRYSGSLQDVSRMAQNIAGVSGTTDSRNDIVIRGNSPNGLLWRFEGVDIPSPNHFASLGTTGGAISMVNINNLQNSEFFTGAFPAEYSNATAGVFDLSLKKGNNKEYEFLGQIGFNGFELGVEGPFKKGKNSTFIINYRHSTLEVFEALGIDLGIGDGTPQYKDLNFKFHFPTRKYGTFQVFGLGGLSFIDLAGDDDGGVVGNGENNVKYRSNTGVIGASHKLFLNKKTFIKTVVAASGTENNSTVDSTAIYGDGIVYGADNLQSKVSGHISLNSKINAKNKVVGGIIVDAFGVDLVDSLIQDNGDYLDLRSFTGALLLARSYIQWKHRVSNKVTLNSGVSSQFLIDNKSFALEPRVGLKYQVNTKNVLAFGTGLHSQMQVLDIYFNGQLEADGTYTNPNKQLDFSKSFHVVGSYTKNLKKKTSIKTEIYYQYLYSIPVNQLPSSFSVTNLGGDFSVSNENDLVNDGKGYNYGLEFTLDRSFDKGFYSLTTLSLFESKYQAQDKVWRNTIYNGNYVLNSLAGKEFKVGKENLLTFDIRGTVAGNKRYTPILIEESKLVGSEVRDETQVYEAQYDPFVRIDFKVGFRLNGGKASQLWAVDFQNLTGQKNIFSQEYNDSKKEILTVYQRGFFPAVIYQVLF